MTQSYGWNLQRLQHSRNEIRVTPCHNDFGHEVVAGERSIFSAGFGSSCPSAGSHSMTRVRGSSLRRWRLSRCRPVDDHPCCHCVCRRSTCHDWWPGGPGGFNVPRCWVIPIWRRWCPRECWHIAHCLCEMIVSAKLLYSHKTVWCWLSHGCADQHGSFVKLCLLSNQQCSRHICSWVKMKRYRRQAANQWRRYTRTCQIIWPCCKAYALAVTLAQVMWIGFQVVETWVEFRVENRSFEYSNFV